MQVPSEPENPQYSQVPVQGSSQQKSSRHSPEQHSPWVEHADPLTRGLTSTGQAGEVPVQYSTMSQPPAEGLHTTLELAKPFAGHELVLPVQYSGTSQTPALARHM
jgi:hypothetical protein